MFFVVAAAFTTLASFAQAHTVYVPVSPVQPAQPQTVYVPVRTSQSSAVTTQGAPVTQIETVSPSGVTSYQAVTGTPNTSDVQYVTVYKQPTLYDENSVQIEGSYLAQINYDNVRAGRAQLSYERFFANSNASFQLHGGVMIVENYSQPPVAILGANLNFWTTQYARDAFRVRAGLIADAYLNNRARFFNKANLSGAARTDFYTGFELGARLGFGDGWFADVPVEIGLFTTNVPAIFAFNAGLQLGRSF